MHNNRLNACLPISAVLLATAVAVPCTAASLQPSRLEVHLLNSQSGNPVAGAAVCLGTSARLDQLGARRSDSKGVVQFDEVSPNPLVLTVSGNGYQGRRQALEPLYESRVLVVKLVTGGGGPECDAPRVDTADTGASSLTVDAVRVSHDANKSADRVLVAARVSGSVNQIRISEQADFGDVEWRPYQPAVAFTLSAGQGAKQLYVQVRRAAEVQGASLEVVSPVKKVTYRQK